MANGAAGAAAGVAGVVDAAAGTAAVVGAAVGAGLVSAFSLPPHAATVRPMVALKSASFNEVFMLCPFLIINEADESSDVHTTDRVIKPFEN